MNPLLIQQIEQLFQWGISGVLAWKANQATNAAFAPALTAALQSNTPVDAATWASIDAAAQAAHDALANA